MIYMNTKYGWYSTGKIELGQLPIAWNRYARTYYDSSLKDFCFPGANGYYRSRGFGLSAITKMKMWISDESYPLFNENDYNDLCTDKIKLVPNQF